MKKLICMVLLLSLLLCSCGTTDLYEYALTREDVSFISTTGGIFKPFKNPPVPDSDGSISTWQSNAFSEWHMGTISTVSRAAKMDIYDYSVATDKTVYIRNDGSIWAEKSRTESSRLLVPYPTLSDSPPEVPAYDISAKISYGKDYINMELQNNGESALPSPCAHLFIQLKDGSWYACYLNGGFYRAAEYGFDTKSAPVMTPSSSTPLYSLLYTGIDLAQGEVRSYNFDVPAKHGNIIPGKYLIAIYSGQANGDTYNESNYSYKTWPIADSAQLEYTIEFSLKNSVIQRFKLSDFESTIEDITVK